MAGQDLNRSIKIYIDGSEAAKGIEPVKKAIADLETKLGKLTGQEADYEEKSKQLKKQLESKTRALQNYEKNCWVCGNKSSNRWKTKCEAPHNTTPPWSRSVG